MLNMDLAQILVWGLVAIIAICMFMILRGVILWYFKIDVRLKNQEKQNELLSEIAEHLKREKPTD